MPGREESSANRKYVNTSNDLSIVEKIVLSALVAEIVLTPPHDLTL